MDAHAALKSSPLFRGVDRRALRGLAEAAEWLELRGGDYLYRVGGPGDALYLVVNGRIRVQRSIKGQAPRILGEAGLGQTVGEIALVGGEDRTADALAVRDSRLLRISQADFERLLHRHPDAMLALMRVVVSRLRRSQTDTPRDTVRSTRTLAVLPAHPGVDVHGFARILTRQLAASGSALRLDRDRVGDALGEGAADIPFDSDAGSRVGEWLNQIEDRYRYLVYQATDRPEAWTRRSLRQADRLLVLADASSQPVESENLQWLRGAGLQAPVELVLLQFGDAGGTSTLAWRATWQAGAHHHVPADMPAQAMGRLARLLTGNALCLVLGGGGARGFAHLGLMRALEEKGLAVDAVAGTSMGALVGAMVASGMDTDTMLTAMRDTFIAQNYLNDYSLPRMGLISGDKFRGRLNMLFGDQQIEDLPVPFFCESTNLTRGVSMLHDRGRVADWVGTSMAVPGITPPNVYNGELLVDGGVLRNIPFEPMHALGRGSIIVSDVSREPDLHVDADNADEPQSLARFKSARRNLNIFKILFHTATLASEQESRDLDQRADLVLHMPTGDVGMFEWDQLDDIAYRAYYHADTVLDQWLAGSVKADS